MRVLVIAAGRYPVPAVKGGAISTLIENIVSDNENNKCFDLEVISPYNAQAVEKSKIYTNTCFWFIRTPRFLKYGENILYRIIHKLVPNKNCVQIKSSLSFVWYLIQSANLLRKRDYDSVIIENTARLFLAIKLFGNKQKYSGKIIYHLHNEPKKLGGCNDLIISSNKVVCVSEYISKKILEEKSAIKGLKKENVRILYNSIDTNLFKPLCGEQRQKIRASYGIGVSDSVVLFAGRIDAEKGIRELLCALDYIKTSNLKVIIVGSSFYGMDVTTKFEEEIQNLAKKHQEKIIFTGFVQYEKMPDLYGCADLAVLPSMWEEPAGLTIIESMSCGTPVITTISGGIPEYASNEYAILLKRDNDIVHKIASSVEDYFNDKYNQEKMSIEGRRHVLTSYSKDGYALRLKTIIES